MSKKTRHYEEKFKDQIVMLNKSGKSLRKITEEYEVQISRINGCVKLYERCGSFKLSDNLSESEKELIKLKNIEIFHTYRGSEFKNKDIDKIINTFGITLSLSRKGNPYDNAVSESIYSILKTEFVNNEQFENLTELTN